MAMDRSSAKVLSADHMIDWMGKLEEAESRRGARDAIHVAVPRSRAGDTGHRERNLGGCS
jgi:hypothetical protein